MGVYESLADRALLLLKRIGFNGAKCAFIGGLAVQAGMVQACKKKFNCEICIPDDPQLTTVHGSVLMAIQRLQKLGNAVKT
jgi:activator of 2-hydroxyglutaryl-CoA dehydratase